MCGIPSVTLEGEKADWESILTRLDKLNEFGKEPKFWASMLRPIIRRFIDSFDGKHDLDFWSKVVASWSVGSGTTYLSGWITAFCVWSKEGKWMGPNPKTAPPEEISAEEPSTVSSKRTSWFSRFLPNRSSDPRRVIVVDDLFENPAPPLILDHIQYHQIDSADVPAGFCKVDVKLDDNGEKLRCLMVAGHVTMKLSGKENDTIQPSPQWFIFVKEDEHAKGSD
jgi:hypothetical protein